jgi:hypothetical protein
MSDEVTFTIYGLADPVTRIVRYVGRTKNVKLRYQLHLKQPQSRGLREWIAQLSLDGQQPSLMIFETASAKEAHTCEQHWINAMAARHGPLFNIYESTPVPIGQRYQKKTISFQLPVSYHAKLKEISSRKYRTVPGMMVELARDVIDQDHEMRRSEDAAIEEKSIGWIW